MFIGGFRWGNVVRLKMSTDTPTTTVESTAAPARKARRPRTGYRPQGKRALGIVDRRKLPWRRRCEIEAMLLDALGGADGLSDVLRAKVGEAAELAVVAELTRAQFIEGRGVSADDVVRTSRAASLAERRLGIAERQSKRGPNLADYLAGKQRAA